jgi:tetratricopeptide (TPR) repeat protein
VEELGKWFGGLVAPQAQVTPAIQAKAEELTRGKIGEREKIQALYEFVSQHFRYIGVSLGQGRYTPHRAEDVLANRYGDCKDKHTLFAALLSAVGIKAYPALISSSTRVDPELPYPGIFDHVITAIPQGDSFLFLDTTPELAAYGYLLTPLRDKFAVVVPSDGAARLVKTPKNPPGINSEEFHMNASLDSNGTLEGKSRIDTGGDSELVMRLAFRATSESQWNELVQGISGGMGFGGTVSDVLAAQPEAVGQPFWFSYSYHRPEYSNWKEHQISPPLPPLTLPALAEKRKTLAEPVALGSPMELTFEAKVKFPKGMRPVLPRNVKVEEDFASYTATYSFQDGVLSGVRRLKILVSEIPGSKRAAYSTFLDSMLEDQGHYMPVTGAGEAAGVMPGAYGHSDNPEAQKLYDQAYESMKLGQARAAVTALERALRLEPKWSDCWLLLGNAHMMDVLGSNFTRQFDQGMQAYQKAISLEPPNVNGRRLLAKALAWAHRNEEAITAWEELLKLNPTDTMASENVRVLLLETGRYKEALVYLHKEEEEHGDVPEIQLQLGEAYLNTSDEEKAMAHFHKALELDRSAAMLNSVAYSLAESKRDLNDALQYAEEAVKKTEEQSAKGEALDSSDNGVMASLAAEWDTLGWIKFRLADYLAATKYLESAWSVMQVPAIGDHLGQVYEKTGKKRQAAQTYSMTLNSLGQNGDPKLNQRVQESLTSLAAQGVNGSKDAAGDLSAVRSYRVNTIKEWGGGYKTATFWIALTKAQGAPLVWFLSGADELKDHSAELSKIKFRISFPDDGPTRVVQRALLSCSEVSKYCTLILLPVAMPRVMAVGTPQIY